MLVAQHVDKSAAKVNIDKVRIVLNFIKLCQKPGNFNTRMKTRSKAGSGSTNCNLSTWIKKIGEDLARLLFDIILSTQKHYINVPAAGDADEGAADVKVDVVLTVVDEPSIPSPTPPTQPSPPSQDLPSTSQGRIIDDMDVDVDVTLKNIVKDVAVDAEIEGSADVQERQARSQAQIYQIDLEHVDKVLSMQDDVIEPAELQEVVELVTTAKLMTEVVIAASATITVAAPILTTVAALTLTTAPSAARKRKGVVIRDPKETAIPSTIIHSEAKSKDKGKGILVEEPKPLKRQAQIEQDEAYARELEAELNKNIDWDEVIDQVAARRRKGVVIRDPEETATPSTIIHSEAKSKDKGKGILGEERKPLKKQAQIEQDEAYARELEAELNKNIDWDAVIDQVQRKEKEDNAVMRYQALKRRPQTEAQSRKNMMIYLRNVDGFKMDYFKGMTYDDIRLIFEKKFNFNMAFLHKTKEQMEEEDNKALKRLIPNDDDDVYTEATPLALKVPVVDYEIYTENNKPYYKIRRADETHQLYLSFLSMLRNFNREDLEVLWQLVKERSASSKPKNFSNNFMLTTLRAMFEKPNIQTQIWRNQRSVHGLAKREDIHLQGSLLTKCSTIKKDSGQNSVGIQPPRSRQRSRTSKIYSKGLRLLVKELMLPNQVKTID
uniref:Uncharacterized protein n=1 Tax=Tanacetum cinerariifolium TaxID=118510 RepID=A0A6L2LPS4_TANCI|nr:hypothetical protein [Tanacetum cinerariifolium]